MDYFSYHPYIWGDKTAFTTTVDACFTVGVKAHSQFRTASTIFYVQ